MQGVFSHINALLIARPRGYTIEQKIQIRDLWKVLPQNPATPVFNRPDLDITFDLSNWQTSLSA
jgi:hypothetical protein